LNDGNNYRGLLLDPARAAHVTVLVADALTKLRAAQLAEAEALAALFTVFVSGKTVTNILGLLHKAMADAVEEGLLRINPVPRLARRSRRAQGLRSNCDPLALDEVRAFLDTVPGVYRDLYVVWFRTGWRATVGSRRTFLLWGNRTFAFWAYTRKVPDRAYVTFGLQ
jgi:hypothetical protein